MVVNLLNVYQGFDELNVTCKLHVTLLLLF